MTELKLPGLVGLSGYARSGKDTAAAALGLIGYKRFAFADPVRAVVKHINPTLSETDGHRDGGWYGSFPLSYYVEHDYDEDWLKQNTNYRQYLKGVGNGIREIQPWFWADVGVGLAIQEPPAVISDVRFHNEAEAIHRQEGIVIRLHREGYGPESDFEKEVDTLDADKDLFLKAHDIRGVQLAVLSYVFYLGGAISKSSLAMAATVLEDSSV